jgi:2-keto-4-pentenoate hydratase/2-oxohepta-3-ene-1,7-dioic acid hydratase in catechol pathway
VSAPDARCQQDAGGRGCDAGDDERSNLFTKFASSITGAHSIFELPSDFIDWEAELAVVVGKHGRAIEREEVRDHIAGLTVAQDYSDRHMQFLLRPAQFSLAKSYAGFTPLGPWLVTPDEFADPNDLELRCEVDGETMQLGRTSEMNFDLAELIVSHESANCCPETSS